MDKKAAKKEILRIMTYYYQSEHKAELWYVKPHQFIDGGGGYHHTPKSPKQMVDDGRGEEVIKWLNFIMDK